MATKLAQVMKKERVTQQQLSDLLKEHHGVKISRQTIQLFFTGQKRMTSKETELIADILGVEVTDIDGKDQY